MSVFPKCPKCGRGVLLPGRIRVMYDDDGDLEECLIDWICTECKEEY
jgi:hypothetical protein